MLCRHRLKSEVSCRRLGRVKATAAPDPPRSSWAPLQLWALRLVGLTSAAGSHSLRACGRAAVAPGSPVQASLPQPPSWDQFPHLGVPWFPGLVGAVRVGRVRGVSLEPRSEPSPGFLA